MLAAQQVVGGVAVPDQMGPAAVHEHFRRVAVAEEEDGRGGGAVGAGAVDPDEVPGPDGRQRNVLAEGVVGGAEGAGDHPGLVGGLVEAVEEPHREVAFDEGADADGGHVVVGASVRDGEVLAQGGLHIADPDHIGARRGRQIAAQLQQQPRGGVGSGEGFDQRVEAVGQDLRVQVTLLLEVADAQAPAHVDEFEGEAQLFGDPLREAQDARGVLDDDVFVEDAGAQIGVDAHEPDVRVPLGQPLGGEDLLLVDAELAGLAAHGETGALDRETRVDPQGDRGLHAVLGGEFVDQCQFLEGLHDGGQDAFGETGGDLLPALPWPEEDDVVGRDPGPQRGHQLGHRGDLGAGAQRAEQGADRDVRVGLEREEHLQRRVQRGVQPLELCAQHVPVVQIERSAELFGEPVDAQPLDTEFPRHAPSSCPSAASRAVIASSVLSRDRGESPISRPWSRPS